jgi:NAD(P)H-nitrite reductase large subunit
VKFEVSLPSGDILSYDSVENQVTVRGCDQLVSKVSDLLKISKDPKSWPNQELKDHVSVLINQLKLKVEGKWLLPYTHEELCHCRQVPTQVVEELIILGVRSQQEISHRCRAGTGCGTCRKDIVDLIEYYRSLCG